MPRRTVPSTWVSYWDAFRMFTRGATFPTAVRIALVVGTWLSLMNQSGPIVRGHPPWAKLVLNYLTPFTVASLGFLAARRRRNVERLTALLADEFLGRPTSVPTSEGSVGPTSSLDP